MADNEGTKIPGELSGGETKTFEQDQQALIEEQARAKGWRPPEEFSDGSDQPIEFLSAKEFLAREPLFDKIKEQGKSINKLKKTVEAMVNQHETQVAAQVKLKLKELEEQRDEAIDLGDKDAVKAIDKEIDQQKVQLKEEEKKLPEELEAWIEENADWFKTDKEMNAFAITHNKTYFANNPGISFEDSLKATKAAVEKAFPEKFKKEEPKPRGPDGGGEPKGGNGKQYTMSRLTPEQKLVYEQHVTRYKILKHDEFFKGLEEIGELQ